MLKLFKKKIFLVFLLLIVVYATVYFIGPLLEFEGTQQRNAALLVTGITASIFLIRYIITRYQAWKFSRALKGQKGGEDGEAANPELEKLEQEFDRAIGQLAARQSHSGLFGKNAGTALPWITIIGPPGSGKSTALETAGLHFTKLGRRVKGIGGTRNCEWWLAEEAVFIDTAGRYSTRNEDHEEWIGFLQLLKHHRRQRPLDAAIMMVALDDVLNHSDDEIENLALNLQERLLELTHHVGTHLPVFLIFNKCDRLSGFSQFFSHLGKRERRKPWGFSLTDIITGSPQFSDAIERRFDRMVGALSSHISPNLIKNIDDATRDALVAFPLEFKACANKIQLFADVLFEPRRRQASAPLKGIYFLSATQDGPTLPGVHDRLAALLGGAVNPAPTPLDTRAYFVRGVFDTLITTARSAARPTEAALRRQRIQQALTATALAPLCFALSWGAMQQNLYTKDWLDAVASASQALAGQSMSPTLVALERKDFARELGNQNTLIDLLESQEPNTFTRETHALASRLLLSRIDHQIILPTERVLDEKLQNGERWSPELDGSDEAEGANTEGLSHSNALFGDGYLALKAGHILAGKSCEGADPRAAESWMASYFSDLWRVQLGDRWERVANDDAPLKLQRSLLTFFKLGGQSQLQVNMQQWTRTSENLSGQIPPEGLLFHLMIQETGLSTLKNQLCGKTLGDTGILEAFSHKGCPTFHHNEDRGQAWWSCVLDARDVPDIRVNKYYFDAYTQAWKRWIETVYIREDIDTLNRAVKTLTALSRTEGSELDALLNTMGGNKVSGCSKVSRARQQLTIKRHWLRRIPILKSCNPDAVSDTFTNINQIQKSGGICLDAQDDFIAYADLVNEKNPKNKALEEYKEALAALRDHLQEMESADATNRRSRMLALVLATSKGDGLLTETRIARLKLIDTLEASSGSTGVEAVNTLLASIEEAIIKVMLEPAAKALQSRWQAEVYDALWRNIRPKKGSAIVDPESCPKVMGFASGDLKDWAESNIAPFLKENNLRRCEPKEIAGIDFPINPKACRSINRLMSCQLKAECPEVGGGDEGPPKIELQGVRFDASSKGCPAQSDIETVWIDDGENKYECTTSSGTCRLSGDRSGGKSAFLVKTRSDARPRLINQTHSGPTLDALLKTGIRRGDWLHFHKVRRDKCNSGDLRFSIRLPKPKPAGAPKKKPDACLSNLSLYKTIILK